MRWMTDEQAEQTVARACDRCSKRLIKEQDS